MSEKQLREGIDCHLCPEEAECGLCNRARVALAADPDVVKVMRKIVDEICKGTLSPEQAWAVGLIKRWIEEEFGIELTDDSSWEWTEDGFQDPEMDSWAKPDCMP